ncbi:hypothetical protein SDRG_12485, partial [Saprolegnia diclina VS20]
MYHDLAYQRGLHVAPDSPPPALDGLISVPVVALDDVEVVWPMHCDTANDVFDETRDRVGVNVPPHRVSMDAAWEATVARQLRPLVAHLSADVTIALAHLSLAT